MTGEEMACLGGIATYQGMAAKVMPIVVHGGRTDRTVLSSQRGFLDATHSCRSDDSLISLHFLVIQLLQNCYFSFTVPLTG